MTGPAAVPVGADGNVETMVPPAPEEPGALGAPDAGTTRSGRLRRRGPSGGEAVVTPPTVDSAWASGFEPVRGGGAGLAGVLGDDRPFFYRDGAPPLTRSDGGVWVMLAVVGFLVGQIVALIAVLGAAALAGQSHNLDAIGRESIPPEWYVLSSLVGLWVGFLGAPWLASRFRGTRHFVADLGLRFRWVDLAGIVVGVGGQLLVAVLYAPFIKHLHNFSAPTQKLTGSSHGFGFFVIAVFTVVGAPFMEELFFRGLLLRGLLRLFAPGDLGRRRARLLAIAGAVVLDGLLFALAHAEWEQFAGLALFGMALALISYRTGRLGMNMVAHGTFNLVAVIAVLGTRGVIH